MTNKKLCVNCAYFKPAVLDNKRARLMYASCVSPHIKRVDNYVVGGQDPQFDKCVSQRMLDYISCRIYGLCGTEGRFFEFRRGASKFETFGGQNPPNLDDNSRLKPSSISNERKRT